MHRPIHLLPNRAINTVANLERAVPGRPIIACDFYVEHAEAGTAHVAGFQLGAVLNVDHHAPVPRMERPISSTNLALACLACPDASHDPALAATAHVVVNHTDCDSVLSAGLMAGVLPPDPALGAAAIAADHTGAADLIADALQAIDHLSHHQDEPRRRAVFDLGLASAQRLLAGDALDPVAHAALDKRLRRRDAAATAVAHGALAAVDPAGRVVLGVFDEPLDGEFFPALVPDAWAIVLANPRRDNPTRWDVKLRLGMSAPTGLSLHHLDVRADDPAYGGRWNAGSNRRGGGTALDPVQWAEIVATRVLRARPATRDRH